MPNATWKQREREIAEMFGTSRNPLSGSNNRADDGSKRQGDILYSFAIIEVKLRKDNSTIKRALETKKLADKHKLPFMHIETLKGKKDILALCVDKDTARILINKFKTIVEVLNV